MKSEVFAIPNTPQCAHNGASHAREDVRNANASLFQH